MFLTTKTFGMPLIGWCFAVGFFAVLIFSLLFIFVPESYDTKLRATAMGFCIQVGRLVAAVAALTGGQLISAFGGSYATAGAMIALFYVVGIVASMFVKTPTEDLLHAESPPRLDKLAIGA
jgi:MFS family permease